MNTPALPLKGAFHLRSAKPLLNDYFVSEELVENLSTRFLLNKTMAKGPALVLQVACASSSSGFARSSQGATRPSISYRASAVAQWPGDASSARQRKRKGL